MLQLKNIVKTYHTGELRQDALKGVSLSFRDNEFVSILGQSGSGKTTLLNIIGGLDRYSRGDLIINGVSTKEYGDRDWDIYRNHSIGFIFQSYNLILHQTVLSNVEMALTLAGISKKERRERAVEALKKVGLEEHIHKKPNQMSGGQMQRVAIARALINNPEILLADEPTGALDTETSIQIMELLKEIAKDKLVIMVTHNPELAEEYSTRIVRLSDGRIISDSDPYDESLKLKKPNKTKKISMSFFTALSLSFNNLKTKKGRTLLTAMAGSIGIVGIGLILAISTGMTAYIDSIQKDTMSQYPITISREAIDTGAMYGGNSENGSKNPTEEITEAVSEETTVLNGIYSDFRALETSNIINTVVKENDLAAFKKHLDSPSNEFNKYLGEKGVVYSYNVRFNIFTRDTEGNLIDTDSAPELQDTSTPGGGFLSSLLSGSFNLFGGSSDTAENFREMPKGNNGEIFDTEIKENYDLISGEWPDEITDTVLVLDSKNRISLEEMFSLGLITNEQYNEIANQINGGAEASPVILDYTAICGKEFYLVTPGNRYKLNENGTYTYMEETEGNEDALTENSLKLTVTGVIKRKEGAQGVSVSGPVAYSAALREYIISTSGNSSVVTAQMSSPEINVLTGLSFEILSDSEKISATKKYLASLSESEKSSIYKMISLVGMGSLTGNDNREENTPNEASTETVTVPPVLPTEPSTEKAPEKNSSSVGFLGMVTDFFSNIFGNIKNSFESISKLIEIMQFMETLSEQYPEFTPENIGNLMDKFQDIQSGNYEALLEGIDIESIIKDYIGSDFSDIASSDSYFAKELDKWLESSPDEKILLTVYEQYITQSSYEENMDAFGYIDINSPSSISLYSDNFENKDALAECIKTYNETAAEEQKISYQDFAAMLTSSLTSIINGISYVLVAFVAISLFVSGIMIGIITHISVMERTKEIGILRALGASKTNISQVFNAETFIIGWCSGLLGVIITLIGIIPINAIIEAKTGIENLDAQLPFTSAAALIMISIAITLTGGLIPALKAAKKDPVVALRTE